MFPHFILVYMQKIVMNVKKISRNIGQLGLGKYVKTKEFSFRILSRSYYVIITKSIIYNSRYGSLPSTIVSIRHPEKSPYFAFDQTYRLINHGS